MNEQTLGTCDYKDFPHPSHHCCRNWKPIAPHDPAEGFGEWKRNFVRGYQNNVPLTAIENDIARAAWIASAERKERDGC